MKLAGKGASDTSWTISTPDTSDYIGKGCDIAVDGSNSVHISETSNSGYIRYTTNTSGSWSGNTTGASGTGYNFDNSGDNTAIAIDKNNYVHISSWENSINTLQYVTNNPSIAPGLTNYNTTTKWGYTSFGSASNTGKYSDIQIDGNNCVHIVYSDLTSGAYAVKHKTNATGSWVTETIESEKTAIIGYYISFKIDKNNKLHVSYYDSTNFDLKYATNTSGSWVVTTIDSTGNTGLFTGIALDKSNNPHIVYYDMSNYYLRYATNASGSWLSSTIDTSCKITISNYAPCSIAIDSNDKVHISCYDMTPSTYYNLKYLTW